METKQSCWPAQREAVCECVEAKSQCRQVSSEWAAWEVQAVTWETPDWNLSPAGPFIIFSSRTETLNLLRVKEIVKQ